ncbi:TolC family outer membrane protein [Pseudomonas sp. MAP12]|uniref:TolC family outer membrane protein n=1 Tax=Geopseudomonas aromaticivorans TaxID=2849492 RepID=A0ABS6N288_9GAMM|nr:TolC family outer membrane protein [Pseudomonas aromaticivorans]
MLRRLALAIALAGVPGLLLAEQQAPSTRADLIGVYQQALENNADLAAARADYLARKEVVPQARSGLLPQLNGGASLSDSKTELDQPSVSLERSGTLYQASLSQALFRADRWFQLQAAKAVSEQAALQLTSVEQNLILQSAEAYFAVLRAQDGLAASRAEEAALKRHYDQANYRFEVGLSDRTEVLEAQSSYDTARANRILAERLVEDAFQALATLTNRDYSFVEGMRHTLPINPPAPNDAKAWVDTAMQRNLDLQASQYAVTGAEETLRQRKAGHAPTVDLVAQYQKGDNDRLGFTNSPFTTLGGAHLGGDVEQQSIGVQLNIPLSTGGLTSSQVRESYQRLNQTEQLRESLRRQVVQNTRDFHRAVNTDVAQVSARKQAIVSSQSALEATELGYEVGTRNIVDVLDAQRQLYLAVRLYNNTRYDYILNHLRLKRSAGILSPADLQDLESFLKPDYNPDQDFLPPGLAPSLRSRQGE